MLGMYFGAAYKNPEPRIGGGALGVFRIWTPNETSYSANTRSCPDFFINVSRLCGSRASVQIPIN